MKLKRALIWHSLFWLFYMMTLTQFHEYAHALWKNGLIDHPFWSHVIVHHGWWGFGFMALVWIFSNYEDYLEFYQRVRSF